MVKFGISRVQRFFERLYAPMMKDMNEQKAIKYTTMLRTAYFFSTTTLALLMYHEYTEYERKRKEKEKEKLLESGLPVILGEDETLKQMRLSGAKVGIIKTYDPQKGWHSIEYHEDEYKQKLAKDAYERALEAQRKAKEENRPLPPDSIRLLEDSVAASVGRGRNQ